MHISPINLINTNKYSSRKRDNGNNMSCSFKGNNFPQKDYSSENVKANFLHFWGFSSKVGKVDIVDRNTGKPVQADVKRYAVGPYVTFNLNIGRKELGFLTMNRDSIYPVAQHVMTLPTDNIPKIDNLRTIEGEKYSGIGTALIKTAIQESYNNKCYGNLWLQAEKGYERNRSCYRSNENPIPFYYKMGFKSPDEEIDSYIKKCIQENKLHKLPDIAVLILTPEARDKWLHDISLSPVMKPKNYRRAG